MCNISFSFYLVISCPLPVAVSRTFPNFGLLQYPVSKTLQGVVVCPQIPRRIHNKKNYHMICKQKQTSTTIFAFHVKTRFRFDSFQVAFDVATGYFLEVFQYLRTDHKSAINTCPLKVVFPNRSMETVRRSNGAALVPAKLKAEYESAFLSLRRVETFSLCSDYGLPPLTELLTN